MWVTCRQDLQLAHWGILPASQCMWMRIYYILQAWEERGRLSYFCFPSASRRIYEMEYNCSGARKVTQLLCVDDSLNCIWIPIRYPDWALHLIVFITSAFFQTPCASIRSKSISIHIKNYDSLVSTPYLYRWNEMAAASDLVLMFVIAFLRLEQPFGSNNRERLAEKNEQSWQ